MDAKPNEVELAPLPRIFVSLLLAYMVLGAVFTTLAYLLTGVAQFGVCHFGPSCLRGQVAQIPDLVIAFAFVRIAIGFLVAVFLALCIRKKTPNYVLLVIGVGIPVMCELFFARPFNTTWVGNLMGLVWTWPDVPEYIMPAEAILRTGSAYMFPPFLAGLGVSIVAIVLRNRRNRPDDGDRPE